MTREEKIKELLQNEETMKEIFSGNEEEILANFAAHGVELTMGELSELSSGILAGMGAEGDADELSEDALRNVAGGGVLLKCITDVANAVNGGRKAARNDKKNKSIKGFGYVDSANTIVGKGWRAIGYTIGYYIG